MYYPAYNTFIFDPDNFQFYGTVVQQNWGAWSHFRRQAVIRNRYTGTVADAAICVQGKEFVYGKMHTAFLKFSGANLDATGIDHDSDYAYPVAKRPHGFVLCVFGVRDRCHEKG